MYTPYIMTKEPCLIVFSGPPLTGKTKLARELSKRTEITYLDVDEIRKEMYKTHDKSIRLSPDEEKEKMKVSYTVMYERVRDILKTNKSVIAIATHSRSSYYYHFLDIVKEIEIPLHFFRIETPIHVIRQRLAMRLKNPHEHSNIRTMEDYLDVANRFEEYQGKKTILDSTRPIIENIEIIINQISLS